MEPRPSLLVGPELSTPRAATVIDALVENAADDLPYLVFHRGNERSPLSARATFESTVRWATSLRARGVRSGSAVAIMLPTSPDFVGALLGSMLLGALPMPLATPMTFGPLDRYLENVARAIRHAGAQVLVATPRIVDAALASSLAGVLTAALTPEVVAGARASAMGPSAIDARTPALLQYTSGTTGTPRGVVLSHGAIVANAGAIAHGLALGASDVGVSWLPLYHDMGLVGALLTALVHPYTLHLMSPEEFVMRPRRWLELVSRVGATVSTAPNFAYELTTRKVAPDGLDLGSLRAALDGAEPVHGGTLRRFADRFTAAGLDARALTPVYGLAEATLAVSFHPLGSPVEVRSLERASLERGQMARWESGPSGRELVSCGAPVAGTTLSIADEAGTVVPEGTIGEICVAGPSLMEGYHRDEPASETVLVGGRLRTGDLGFLQGGRLFVSGRARDLIIQGGRNVHPEDVERVAVESDAAITSAAAFAAFGETKGTEELVVVLEARGLDAHAKDVVASRVRGELLAVMGVRADAVAVWPTGTIPRTSSGKVRRRECAAQFAAGDIR